MALRGQAGIWRQDPRNAEELATAAGRRLSGSPVGRTRPARVRARNRHRVDAGLCAGAHTWEDCRHEANRRISRGALVRAQRFGAARRLAEGLGRNACAAKNESKVVIIGSPDPVMRNEIIQTKSATALRWNTSPSAAPGRPPAASAPSGSQHLFGRCFSFRARNHGQCLLRRR